MHARSLLFTIYGDFVLRYGDEVRIGSLVTALAVFGIQAPAVRMAVSRLAQEGLLAVRKEGTASFYRLTDKGRHRVENGVRRLYRESGLSWDGNWHIVTLTGPEEPRTRERMRTELMWRGFGQLSPCTWISFHRDDEAVRQLALDYGLTGQIHQFTARYDGPDANADLVRRCWNLDDIAARYHEFIAYVWEKQAEMRRRMSAGEPIPDAHCFAERILLVHAYRKFLHIDPGLPQALLPAEWAGTRARDLFQEYYRLLSEKAERFFLELLHPAGALGGLLPATPVEPEEPEESDAGGRRRRTLPNRDEW